MGAVHGKVVEVGSRHFVIQSQLKSTGKDRSLYVAKDSNGQTFVLKRTVVKKGLTDVIARAKWEADLYQNLPKHKNLLTCFGLKRCADKDGNSESILILEYCSGGSLKNVLSKEKQFAIPDLMKVLRNLCSALLFLHSRDPPIVHLGIRLDNVFLHANGDWMLGDLGWSAASPIKCSGPDELRKFVQLIDVPRPYRSPEIVNIRTTRIVDVRADTWALGVVFYAMLFGRFPFESDKAAISAGKYEIPLSPAYEKPVIDLLESLLCVNPLDRPNTPTLHKAVVELYEHYCQSPEDALALTGGLGSKGLMVPDTALAHAWGHSWTGGITIGGSNSTTPTRSKGKASLSVTASESPNVTQRVQGEINAWIVKALGPQLVPPKPKYVRRMVILAWERHDSGAVVTLPGLFEGMFRLPVFSSAVMSYKALQMVHKLIQEGPPAFSTEALHHRSFFLTVSERWQSQQPEMDPWLAPALTAYAMALEQRLLFLVEACILESNFSLSAYIVRASADKFASMNTRIWFGRCIDVVQRLLELGLKLISCGSLSMGTSGVGPSRQHLVFRETVLVPIFDDLFAIFSVSSFLLGIVADCHALHHTDIRDSCQLYQSFFSKFHALLLRASKSALVAMFERLPTLPPTIPDLGLNSEIYPIASNVPSLASHTVEYCELLRSLFQEQLEAMGIQVGFGNGSATLLFPPDVDSRSATAPAIRKASSSTNLAANDQNLQDIFASFGASVVHDFKNTAVLENGVINFSSSSPASPISPMTKRSRTWTRGFKQRSKTPSGLDWDPVDVSVEWTPVTSSNSSRNPSLNATTPLDFSPSSRAPKEPALPQLVQTPLPAISRHRPHSASPQVHDNRQSPTAAAAPHSPFDLASPTPAFRPTKSIRVDPPADINSKEDEENPFNVIEKSIKMQSIKMHLVDMTSAGTASDPSLLTPNQIVSSEDEMLEGGNDSDDIHAGLSEGEIAFDEVKIGERIGIGGFAEVYKGEWRGTEIALKKMLVQKQDAASLREFRKEVSMLRSLRHPNVVMFMGACTRPPNLFMVTELLQMSLFDLLHNTNVKLNWKLILKIALDTATGVNFLHHSGIIHRDLKSANLLLDKHYGVKVSDFGLSRVKAQQVTMTGQCGTFQWMAPEVICNEKYSEKADVYSFGVILWETVARVVPFEGMNGVQVSVAVSTRGLRPTMPSDIPEILRALIEDCWAALPDTRPPFGDIVSRLKLIQSELVT